MKKILVTTALLSIFTLSQLATAANKNINKNSQLATTMDIENNKRKGRNPRTGREVKRSNNKSWEDAIATAVKEASK
ncbi:MAG: hypothetical protein KAG34_10140 [Cocleimonas sp.]|nr:hypothetical protein [Cocleimonas sp.]